MTIVGVTVIIGLPFAVLKLARLRAVMVRRRKQVHIWQDTPDGPVQIS